MRKPLTKSFKPRESLTVLTLNQLQTLTIFTDIHIVSIAPLTDGLSHQLYKMSYNSHNDELEYCVLRFISADIKQTSQEYLIMQQTYALGLSPKPSTLLDVTDQVGQCCTLIVMDFVEGDLAINKPLNNKVITQLSNFLTILHQTSITNSSLTKSTNTPDLLDEYWAVFNMKTLNCIKRFGEIKRAVQTMQFDNSCLIHGDLNLSNILITPDKMTWIDWEYSSIGDPYFDYATLCVESTSNIEEKLITALEANELTDIRIDRERLRLFKLYYAATCWLWSPALSGKPYTQHRYRYEAIVDQLLITG